jgi:hypothetical protein
MVASSRSYALAAERGMQAIELARSGEGVRAAASPPGQDAEVDFGELWVRLAGG